MSTDRETPEDSSDSVPLRQVGNGQPAPVVCPPSGFRRAVALLRAGQLVAFPTDTVYGVGAVIWNRQAIRQLYEAKLRPSDKAIPVLLASAGDLSLVARDLSQSTLRLAERFWPGPLTLVVPRAPAVPDEVGAGGATVAVRVPDHDLARALILAAGAPLATTSANLSGQASAVTAQEVAAQLGSRIPLVLDGGPCPGGVASTVVDLTGPAPAILRPGPVSLRDILSALEF
jgi:L-threonylcarbamoyladenylate synthase